MITISLTKAKYIVFIKIAKEVVQLKLLFKKLNIFNKQNNNILI